MNYTASISDFFKSPKWLMNVLLAGLCAFIPIVGPMVVFGWLITGFWSRPGAAPEAFPDFDFSNFGKWLQRGLWPTLVAMVASIGFYVVFVLPMVVAGAALGASAGQGRNGAGGIGGAVLAVGMVGAEGLVLLAMTFVIKPLMIRAALIQDFGKAFDFSFVKSFVSLVWLELVLSVLFMMLGAFVISLVGMLALCVGMFFTPPVIYFMMVHLDRQIYRLYLSRGGAEVPLSPSLAD